VLSKLFYLNLCGVYHVLQMFAYIFHKLYIYVGFWR